jgi:hypothetical protein
MRIIRTKRYLKDMKRLGASPTEMSALETSILFDPLGGSVMPGLNGVRKIRFAFGGRGKRGGGRAIYFLKWADEAILMITAYAKNEKQDLSPADRKVLLALVKEFTND